MRQEAIPKRRPPPAFRRAFVEHVHHVTPHMVGVTLEGTELEGFAVEAPASSIRLLLPTDDRLTIPRWNGNEFLLPDGTRPHIRTFTPLRFNPSTLELDLEIVVHDAGTASDWARSAIHGDPVAVSGPGRGITIDRRYTDWLIAGDETAIPATFQLLDALPHDVEPRVFLEIRDTEARHPLPDRPARVEWLVESSRGAPGTRLLDAIGAAGVGPDTFVWAAGEARAMQSIRRHLFDHLPRAQTSVRGYWKHGRSGT